MPQHIEVLWLLDQIQTSPVRWEENGDVYAFKNISLLTLKQWEWKLTQIIRVYEIVFEKKPLLENKVVAKSVNVFAEELTWKNQNVLFNAWKYKNEQLIHYIRLW